MNQKFKQGLISKIENRIRVLEKKCARFFEYDKELKELKATLNSLSVNTKETPSPFPPTVPPSSDPIDLHYNADNPTPLSTEGLIILSKLPEEFETPNLFNLLDRDMGLAYQFIAAWKRAGKITTVKRGRYRKA